MSYKTWTNTTFTGVQPTGTAAVVVAETQTEAADILNKELKRIGLQGDVNIEDMRHVTTGYSHVIVLSNGDY